MDQIFVKDLELTMSIGIYDVEKQESQRVLVSATLDVENINGGDSDDIDDTVSYETIVTTIKDLAKMRHYNLVESFAEEIATACLADKRVLKAKIAVSKPDIFKDAAGVGVRIIRNQA